MRVHMERLVMFPFSLGCRDSESSSVAVGKNNLHLQQPNNHVADQDHHLPITERRWKGRMRSLRNIFSPKSSVFQRLIQTLTSFSHLFVHKEEEEEMEMEIGLPTDVKHVTHIGWDGSNTTINPVKGWENLKAADMMINSFPSISITQFELAMAAQAAEQPQFELAMVAAAAEQPPAAPAAAANIICATNITA